MNITCHGHIAELIKSSNFSEKVNTIDDIRSILSKKYKIEDGYAISVNNKTVSGDLKLEKDDSIKIISPFEGG